MNSREKAEEFLTLMFKKNKKCLVEKTKDLSQGEKGCLFYLTFVENNISASKLSEVLDVSMPRVVSLINTLETKGLIIKSCDQNDKRKTIISIRELGKKLVLDKKEEVINKLSNIIDALGEKDFNEYIRLTNKINNIIEDNNF